MAITLIRCSELVAKSANALTTPPVGVAYLAAHLRQAEHAVQVVDGVGEAIGEFHSMDFLPPDLFLRGLSLEALVARVQPEFAGMLGISCMFSQDWPVYRRLIEQLRARFPQALIVCGGEHISAVPEFVLETCAAVDYCIKGEGEIPLLALAEAWRAGSLLDVRTNIPGLLYRHEGKVVRAVAARASRVRDLDSLAWPAWDLVPIQKYLDSGACFGLPKGRSMPIVATRGCPYSCTFCSNADMWGTNWVPRAPKEVVDEIEHYVRLYRATNFDFYDLTAIVRKDWILEFCREVEQRGLKITYQLPSGTRSEAIDAEVAEALARTGCCHITYAPESGSERMLKLVQKKVKLRSLRHSMRSSVRVGLSVKMNIVIGFPGEKTSDYLHTLGFLARTARLGVQDAFVYTFSPYPGSKLFRELQQSGRIPELTDEYFFSLASYIRLSHAISYSEHISSRALTIYRPLALIWFYALSFLFRPGRLWRIMTNLSRKESDSRIENFLKVLFTESNPAYRLFAKVGSGR